MIYSSSNTYISTTFGFNIGLGFNSNNIVAGKI